MKRILIGAILIVIVGCGVAYAYTFKPNVSVPPEDTTLPQPTAQKYEITQQVVTSTTSPNKMVSKVTPAPAKPAPTSQFSVQKVTPGYVVQEKNEPSYPPLVVTINPSGKALKDLALCGTMTDGLGVSVSETDCWDIPAFGVWNVPHNLVRLAPDRNRKDFWTGGSHATTLRFELIQKGLGHDNDDGIGKNDIVIASDSTGVYELIFPEGTTL